MAEKTIGESKVTREKAAEKLEELARELREDDEAQVRVGNKTIALHPSDELAMEVGVRERSSILRGSRESVTVTLDWKPK